MSRHASPVPASSISAGTDATSSGRLSEMARQPSVAGSSRVIPPAAT
ncbi:hypothetical protein QSJ19_12795 [Gordonia sp. ABSL11-1]|nr:hypothetical protein [Gordonia sp. ABSL11-1]MDL9946455.1 hypothetical protein [Gordonia sp. ABSL11-1]